VADSFECGNKPPDSIKRGNFLTSGEPISFSGRNLLHRVSQSGNVQGCDENLIIKTTKLLPWR
jgi:hypothetical protein